jgi:Domain of unknown function (DUF3841)
MHVWMIADATLYEQLQRDKVLYVDPALIKRRDLQAFPGWIQGNHWMQQQLQKRLSSYRGHYPWWAFVRYHHQHYHGPAWPVGTRLARLDLDTPDDELLLSDIHLWDNVVLQGDPLVASQQEWDAIQQLSAPLRWTNIEQTWERIFRVSGPPDDIARAWSTPRGARKPRVYVQACFETLRLSDVLKVTYYRNRGMSGQPRAKGA